MGAYKKYSTSSGFGSVPFLFIGFHPMRLYNIPSGLVRHNSPVGTNYKKDGSIPSDIKRINKNPERV